MKIPKISITPSEMCEAAENWLSQQGIHVTVVTVEDVRYPNKGFNITTIPKQPTAVKEVEKVEAIEEVLPPPPSPTISAVEAVEESPF